MTTLQWDQVGEKTFETGLDRGVLYLTDGNGVVWNGLVSVTEQGPANLAISLYFDGVKYADTVAIQEFLAVLKAYTYPDEFLECEGVYDAGHGMHVTNQPPQRFGLSYRTSVGDDESGLDAGYKIHVLYNLLAFPAQKAYQSLSAAMEPILFEWNLSAVPEKIPGFQPTAHFIFDSREMSPVLLQDLEDTLYGDGTTTPTLPDASTLTSFIGDWVIMRITEHGDGSWTAEGPDSMITYLDATTFQITQAVATYLDADTYLISDRTY